jgi:hypothetical protein
MGQCAEMVYLVTALCFNSEYCDGSRCGDGVYAQYHVLKHNFGDNPAARYLCADCFKREIEYISELIKEIQIEKSKNIATG